jgi:hypothetical protein
MDSTNRGSTKPIPIPPQDLKNERQEMEGTTGQPERSPSKTDVLFHEDLSFPWRLFSLLNMKSFDHIVSWVRDGTAFQIHDEEEFANVILPQFFPKMSKIKSFKRQLSAYTFTYIRSGRYEGSCK